MANSFDITIIGGGIVGLATALELTKRYPQRKLAILEKEDRLAAHQTLGGDRIGAVAAEHGHFD